MQATTARLALTATFSLLSLLAGCAGAPGAPADGERWAIAIHGGAGTMRRDAPAERLRAYEQAMADVLALGQGMLADGASALDVCEAVVRSMEDNPMFNAGKGAVFNEKGEHELDASIMDGATMRCGAVAGVRTVRHLSLIHI